MFVFRLVVVKAILKLSVYTCANLRLTVLPLPPGVPGVTSLLDDALEEKKMTHVTVNSVRSLSAGGALLRVGEGAWRTLSLPAGRWTECRSDGRDRQPWSEMLHGHFPLGPFLVLRQEKWPGTTHHSSQQTGCLQGVIFPLFR